MNQCEFMIQKSRVNWSNLNHYKIGVKNFLYICSCFIFLQHKVKITGRINFMRSLLSRSMPSFHWIFSKGFFCNIFFSIVILQRDSKNVSFFVCFPGIWEMMKNNNWYVLVGWCGLLFFCYITALSTVSNRIGINGWEVWFLMSRMSLSQILAGCQP